MLYANESAESIYALLIRNKIIYMRFLEGTEMIYITIQAYIFYMITPEIFHDIIFSQVSMVYLPLQIYFCPYVVPFFVFNV